MTVAVNGPGFQRIKHEVEAFRSYLMFVASQYSNEASKIMQINVQAFLLTHPRVIEKAGVSHGCSTKELLFIFPFRFGLHSLWRQYRKPGGGKTPPDKVPLGQKTVTLSLRGLAEGAAGFRISKVALVRQNQEMSASDTFTVDLDPRVDLRTSLGSLLLKTEKIPADVYDRMVVTIDSKESVSYFEQGTNREALGLSP